MSYEGGGTAEGKWEKCGFHLNNGQASAVYIKLVFVLGGDSVVLPKFRREKPSEPAGRPAAPVSSAQPQVGARTWVWHSEE